MLYFSLFPMLMVQIDLRDILGLVSDHRNKANIAIEQVNKFFGFSVHTKVMFTLNCSLLSVQ